MEFTRERITGRSCESVEQSTLHKVLLPLTIDLASAFVNNHPVAKTRFYNVFLYACSQIRDAFIHQLTQGYSHYDRQLRNDLMVLASLIATLCLDAPFVETGFVKQLALFATFQEGTCQF